MKRWLTIILCAAVMCIVFVPFSIQAEAVNAVGESIKPCAESNSSYLVNLEISGTEATATSSIAGLPGTTSVSTTMELQRYQSGKWICFIRWSDSVQGIRMSMSESCPVVPGTYRLVATFTVVNGSSETVSSTSPVKICK